VVDDRDRAGGEPSVEPGELTVEVRFVVRDVVDDEVDPPELSSQSGDDVRLVAETKVPAAT